MRYVSTIILAALLLAGCATQPPTKTYARADVLILSPQGVKTSDDTVGFNKLVQDTTQTFSAVLSKRLQDNKLAVINVLDQNPAYNNGDKLALYSTRHQANKAIVLTLESKTVDSDETLFLRAQYVDLEFNYVNGNISSITPSAVLDRYYLLKSAKTGATTDTFSDIVNNYIDYLSEQGRINAISEIMPVTATDETQLTYEIFTFLMKHDYQVRQINYKSLFISLGKAGYGIQALADVNGQHQVTIYRALSVKDEYFDNDAVKAIAKQFATINPDMNVFLSNNGQVMVFERKYGFTDTFSLTTLRKIMEDIHNFIYKEIRNTPEAIKYMK